MDDRLHLNEVSANKLTGKKIEAYFTQGMHLDLIRECAGRPDRLLNAYLREETYKKKEVCYLEGLELIEDDGEFTLTEA